MKTYELKSFAKINLALHVTGKLTNLHKIESVIKFIDLHDTISINEINKNKHKISFIGIFSKNIKLHYDMMINIKYSFKSKKKLNHLLY